MGTCDTLPQNRKMLPLVSILILLSIACIVCLRRHYTTFHNTNVLTQSQFNDFISPNNAQLENINPIPYHKYMKKIKHVSPNSTNTLTNHFHRQSTEHISHIQNIINAYINQLSTKDYDTFNQDILLNNTTFHHLSFKFLFSAIHNRTIWFHGDSFCRKFWRYVVFVMHHKYMNNTANMDIQSGEKGILSPLLDEENNIALNLSLSIKEKSAEWLVTHEMHNIGVATMDSYKVGNVEERSWYTIFESYFIKLILTAHSLKQNPFIYEAQFLHLNKYLFMPPTSGLDVLFINFQALHLMHLLPARKFEPFAIESIKKLETHFDKVTELAVAANSVKCVIFRPPNPICLNMYKDDWVGLSDFFQNKIVNMSEAEISNHGKIKKCLSDHNIDGGHVYYENNVTNVRVRGLDICSKYSITQIGVDEINERMKRYVFHRQNEIYNEHGVKLIYYDQVKLFSGHCDKTYDGRHYTKLLPVETVAVFNIIQKWC